MIDTENIDFQLKLLSDSPIYISGIPIYSIPLQKIIDIGFSQYMLVIRTLCMNRSQVEEMLNKSEDEDNDDKSTDRPKVQMEPLQFVITHMFYDNYWCNLVIYILSLLCHVETDSIKINFQNLTIEIGDNILSDENYTDFQTVLKYRNYLIDPNDEINENPSNEIARRILEKRRKAREKLAKAKAKAGTETNISLDDIISIYAERSHLLLKDVLDYDIYQFHNQFTRSRMYEEYDLALRQLLAGADSKKVKLKPYMRKISDNEDE